VSEAVDVSRASILNDLRLPYTLESAKSGEKPVCLWVSDPVHKFDKLRVLASDGQGLELRHFFS
jgi:hypothetical protein